MTAKPRLVHWTKTAEAVVNILTEGFGYVALPTKLFDDLLPDIPSAERQPQQFGQVSFRYEPEGRSSEIHKHKYGRFGIVVNIDWALKQGAHPVLYVLRSGSVAYQFRQLFRNAKKSIDAECECYPDDAFRTMGYHNAIVAGGMGALNWARLITIYSYMAPAEDVEESEWRIVQSLPLYSSPKSSSEMVKALSPARGWMTVVGSVRFPREAVQSIITPADVAESLRGILPRGYETVPFTLE